MVESAPQRKLARECRHLDCKTRATFCFPDTPKEVYCGKHRQDGMVSQQNSVCKGQKCKKQGTFKFENKRYCADHKPEDALRSNKDICKEGGCKTRACFGNKADKKVQYCKTHRKVGMVDVINPKCEKEGCEVRAYQTNSFCLTHLNEPSLYDQMKELLLTAILDNFAANYIKPQKNKMICAFDDCETRGTFGLPNQQKPKIKYCQQHRTDTMIDLVHKKCQYEDCSERAKFNFENEKKQKYCFSHQLPGMKDISRQICQMEDCEVRATFGLELDRKRVYCNKHKKEEMVQLENISCREPNCKIRPHFNFPQKKQCLTCYRHKEPGMVNIYSIKCQKCEIMARYDGLCSKCFYNEFPDNPCTRQFKTKERAVVKFLRENGFQNLINDKRIQEGQSNYRPDILIQLKTHNIICEVDEYNHKVYDQEEEQRRLEQIYLDLGKHPLTVIRFNTDGYLKGNTRIKSPWTYQSRNKVVIQDPDSWNERLLRLLDTIREAEITVHNADILKISLFGDQK